MKFPQQITVLVNGVWYIVCFMHITLYFHSGSISASDIHNNRSLYVLLFYFRAQTKQPNLSENAMSVSTHL